MSRELPTISSGTHSHTTYSAGGALNGAGVAGGGAGVAGGGDGGGWVSDAIAGINWSNITVEKHSPGIVMHAGCFGDSSYLQAAKVIQGQEQTMTTRLVRVFVIDPNSNLPLENRMLYNSSEKLTDLNDQELFFELPINDFLAKHNAVRARTVDQTKSTQFGKEIYLEPVRIRDLKMTVLVVAQFL